MTAKATNTPVDHEAERQVLAFLLRSGQDREAVDALLALAPDAAFDHPQSRSAMQAVVHLHNEGVLPTTAEVAGVLHGWGVNSPSHKDLQRLALDTDPGRASALAAARRLHDLRRWRSLLELGDAFRSSWERGGATSDAVIAQAMGDLQELVADNAAPYVTLDAVLRNREQELRASSGKPVRRTLTGFKPLDSLTGGFGEGDLVVLAAATGGGKSALASHVLEEMAQRGQTVLLASAEMAAWEIGDRILSRSCRIPATQIRDNALDAEDLDAIRRKAGDEAYARICVMERRGAMTVQRIGSVARQIQRQRGLGMIVVDYLQLISSMAGPQERGRTRQIEVAAVARGLKNTATELGVPVLALSQFNREAARDGGEPELHHLRESGEIEHAANQVLFLWHPNDDDRETLHLVCKKTPVR